MSLQAEQEREGAQARQPIEWNCHMHTLVATTYISVTSRS